MAIFKNTAPIVTNGLVLYLDTLNPQSLPLDPTVNLVPRPNDPTLWGNGGGVQITSSNAIAPDGTLTANTIAFTGSGAYFAYVTPIGATTGSQYTTSVYIKMISGSTIDWSWGGVHGGNRTNFRFDPSTGTFSNVSVASGEIYGAEQAANGFWRLYASSTLNAGTTPNYYPQLNVSINNTFLMWGTQIERNKYATPLVSGSRTTWFDLSGNNNFATLSTGSITSSIPQYSSLNQRVLNFDGTGSYAFISSSWSYLSSSAIETVFSVNSFQSSEVTSVGGYDQNSTSTFGRSVAGMIYLDNLTKKVNASVITLTQTYRTVTSVTTINTGSFYHVVLNKDTTAGTLQLYVNGVLESTNTFDTGSYAQWFSTGSFQGSNVIQISNTNSTNLLSWIGGKYLNGRIPLFKLYNRTLNQNEILQNFNAVKTRFNIR